MDALAFVEGSEFRKQAARQLAKRIAAEIRLEDLIEQGEAYTDDLLDRLLEALSQGILRDAAEAARSHAPVLGLSVVGLGAVDAVVEQTIEAALAEAMSALSARVGELARAVERMLDAEVGEEVVRATLASEAGATALLAPVAAVLTTTGAGIVNAVEKAVLEEATVLEFRRAIEAGEEEPLFEWETREDDDVCEDIFENSCNPRHGEQLPLEEWDVFGQPASQNLICSIFAKGPFSNCRCVLRRVGAEGRSPTPINIHDAAERGRERAEEAFGKAA